MLFSVTILAVSLSLDALGVGIAYGLRKVYIPLVSKLVICFFSILYSGLALALGNAICGVLPAIAAKAIGVAILTIMGVYIIIQALTKKEKESVPSETEGGNRTILQIAIKSLGITIQVVKNPACGDIDRSGTIDIKESLMLGLALSIDAIGVGIGSALSGLGSMLIPLFIGLFQLLFLYMGTYIGKKVASAGRLNKRVLSLAPGILLITMAVIRIR